MPIWLSLFILLLKRQKLANLVLVQVKKSLGGDQESVYKYSQNVVNGYTLEIRSGDFAGLTMANVYQCGVAGFIQIAKLNDCK